MPAASYSRDKQRPEQDSQDSLSRNALAAPWRCNSSCRVKLATIKWSKLINFALCAASQTDWHTHTYISIRYRAFQGCQGCSSSCCCCCLLCPNWFAKSLHNSNAATKQPKQRKQRSTVAARVAIVWGSSMLELPCIVARPLLLLAYHILSACCSLIVLCTFFTLR